MELFGAFNGEPVKRFRIANNQLSAQILNYGAVVQDLRLASVCHPLVLGFDNFAFYPQHSQSFGIIAGRHANRIKDGHLSLDQQEWQLDRNEDGVTHIHGGSNGIGSRIWQVVAFDELSVHLRILCKHGEMGYPGNLTIDCLISLAEPATLVFDLTAATDATTVCNLAHHSYFNLDGSPTINCHQLQIAADHYLPVDDRLIPTGEIVKVEGTDFDFRQSRNVADGCDHSGQPSNTSYDHNFCLHTQARELTFAAKLEATGVVAMQVHTTEPGIQFYDGNKLNVPVAGLDGRTYGRHAGLCLEPQRWPDNVHQPAFAGSMLRPGELYQQRTEYRLTMT